MHLRKVLFISASLLCFSAPATGWAAGTYQMTPQELTQLENIFSQLSEKQKQQQELLTEQTAQIETLQTQLATSQKEIETSKQSTEALQTSLQQANESLQESAAEAKSELDRLKRQRDTWAILVSLVLGIALVHG